MDTLSPKHPFRKWFLPTTVGLRMYITGITVLSVYGANFDPTNEKVRPSYTVAEFSVNEDTKVH